VDSRARGDGEGFAVLVDSELAGLVNLHRTSTLHAVGSIGYWVGAAYTRKGIMTTAVGACAEIAFREHAIHRLELYAAVRNAPAAVSLNVLASWSNPSCGIGCARLTASVTRTLPCTFASRRARSNT